MTTKHSPDAEMRIMQRGLRELAGLSPAGRRRVLAYWCARVETMPAGDGKLGPQQLDIEDVPQMPALRGAAA
jgi:hypothetical protein